MAWSGLAPGVYRVEAVGAAPPAPGGSSRVSRRCGRFGRSRPFEPDAANRREPVVVHLELDR